MIFVRSRRPTLVLTAATALVTSGLGGAAIWVAVLGWAPYAVMLGILAIFGFGFLLRALARVRRWPASRLGFFRDRLLVIHRDTELRAGWDSMTTVTLAEANEWTAAGWPEVKLTDRLTIHIRDERPFSFRPKSFGLEPVACRDLILQLRDEPESRRRLPEFDSDLDLARAPVAAGQLMKPHL